MKVVLAEKPSVARDIAAFLGAKSRHDGYYEGGGFQVTWALGHLVGLKEPEDYDPALKTWSLHTLPFVPEEFGLKLRGDPRARQQFSVVKRLFQSASQILCATDAGREGELIFRYILTMTGCEKKPVQRLWLNSLTERAIRNAFQSLRPSSDYDNLYAAARCRSEADWIVGLNATRNFTVRYGANGLLWSVGRVQTPVLAMIVRRDDAIRTFKPQPFWELTTRYRSIEFRFTGDRFQNQQGAQERLRRVQGHEFEIRKAVHKPEKSLPPQLYDLTELQRDMNRRFGLSAAETLQTAQSLYENKLITYPRADSRYLTSDMKDEVPRILRRLESIKRDEISKLPLGALPFNSRIVDDKKVGDHHAIIPTGKVLESLSARDQRVYDAIVIRLIAAFSPPCLKEVTTVEGESNKVTFRARGVRIVSPGWTALYPPKPSNADDERPLPDFSLGERGPHEPFLKQGETTPPKQFTENTLLGAMETAGKLVDDAELREAMKETGLGTPATRASIIETLLTRDYITRSKKNLAATDLGRFLVALIQDEALKSPELTGEWESQLKRVEAGQIAPQKFMQAIVQYAREIINASDVTVTDEGKLGDCPRCGRKVIEGKSDLGCSAWRDGCRFVLRRTYAGHPLEFSQIRSLLQHRITHPPIVLKDSRRVVLTLLDSGELLEIPVPEVKQRNRGKTGKPKARKGGRSTGSKREPNAPTASDLGICPLCGGPVTEQTKSFSCSCWRDGCKFVVWKTMAGKRITSRTAKALLRDGHSSLLKGFKSKSGKPFNARLKLVDGRVNFEFDQ
jgi:DNA topoisomerase-3